MVRFCGLRHIAGALVFLATQALAGALPASSAPSGGDLVLSNEYIAITVNDRTENAGRFSIKTTGGDPDRPSDDNAHLIYRLRDQKGPWTSFTTVLIDGKAWVYGGQTRDTAGAGASYGQPLQTPTLIAGKQVESKWQLGPLQVKQSISFVRSSTTGLVDTARIATEIVNTDESEHVAGLRLTLDTMLGDNDGAPFRVGDSAITTDTVLAGDAIPDFWQAFDSLADPKVTAQGTLRGGEVTTPDKVYFTNWASLIEDPWNVKIVPGRDFTREDGLDLDSAMALLWEPVRFKPGEHRTYVTYVGLGGLTIVPGQLSLAITAPSSVVAGPNVTFPVIAYVQNSGTGEARNVTVTINLPAGLRLAGGQQATRSLGNMAVGATGQVRWNVALNGGSGQMSFSVSVAAMNADSNTATRKVDIVAPAQLRVTLKEPQGKLGVSNDQWQPYPYVAEATFTNVGQASAVGVSAKWESSRGLQLAKGDAPDRSIGLLDPGESYTAKWHVIPTGEVGDLPYKVTATAGGGQASASANGLLRVPPLESAVSLQTVRLNGQSGTTLQAGETFLVQMDAHHLKQPNQFAIELVYDPTRLRVLGGVLGIDRGTLFAATDTAAAAPQWTQPKLWVDMSKPLARVAIKGERAPEPGAATVSGSIVVLRMQALAAGPADIRIDRMSIQDQFGQELQVSSSPILQQTIAGR